MCNACEISFALNQTHLISLHVSSLELADGAGVGGGCVFVVDYALWCRVWMLLYVLSLDLANESW